MIVDLHTHLWDAPEQLGRGTPQRLNRQAGQPWERTDASTTAFDAAMEPVQHAVILGLESQYLGAAIPLEQLARYVQRKPGKYLGFAGIDPLAPQLTQKISRVRELGLSGVTICPAAAAFHPSHTRAMTLYEKCAELGLPVLVQSVTHLSGESHLEYAQPHLFDEVAREFPRLKLVIAQVGYPWTEQTLVLIGKHRNIYADLSYLAQRPWQLYNVLLSAHQQGVMDRLMLGSDFPFSSPQKAIATIYSVNTLTQGTMLPSVPREQLRSIVERDTLESLGIKIAGGTRAAVGATQASASATATPVVIAASTASSMAAPATTAPAVNASAPSESPRSGGSDHDDSRRDEAAAAAPLTPVVLPAAVSAMTGVRAAAAPVVVTADAAVTPPPAQAEPAAQASSASPLPDSIPLAGDKPGEVKPPATHG